MVDVAGLSLKIIFSAVDLLRGSVFPAALVLALAATGLRLRAVIEKETKWKWLSSTALSTFVLVWCITLALYFYPAITAMQEQGLGLLPSFVAPSIGEMALSFAYGAVKATVVAAVVSLILLPLEIVGSFVHSEVSARLGRKSHWLIKLAVSAYIMTLIASAAILFLVPWAPTGLLFFLYYGFPA